MFYIVNSRSERVSENLSYSEAQAVRYQLYRGSAESHQLVLAAQTENDNVETNQSSEEE